MALPRALTKRLLSGASSPMATTTVKHSLIPPAPPHLRREFITPPDSSASANNLFRHFLQRRAINNHSSPSSGAAPIPSFFTLPVGQKLREKLNSINFSGDHLRRRDVPAPAPEAEVEGNFGVSTADAKRLMRLVQLEKVRERLRSIPASTMTYGEYVRICGDVCGSTEMGLEFAQALDQCGNVIVLGGVVFLRPDQVAKSMENLISQSIAMPNDPRKKELENLENQKALIDKKAQSLVRGELYSGLGFLVLQTLGFMRLTFWELSWDVMEPICFFVTSLHFALAYTFFLRTSSEPTFEGYFQRRFKVKQKKLMKSQDFDIERYNQLCEIFYPNYDKRDNKSDFEYQDRVIGASFNTVRG